MKKLLLLFTTICISISFTSCLNSDNTTNAVTPGITIYYAVKPQVYLDLDPLIVALKLNTLIVTADSLGVDYKVAEVVIKEAEEGDDDKDGKEEEKLLVIEQLFGKNNVTKSGTKWTIEYDGAKTFLEKELCYRKGSLTIETNGYTLAELDGTDSMWEITAEGGNYEVTYSGVTTVNNAFDYYYIQPHEQDHNRWSVSGQSKAYVAGSESYAADSEISYDLQNKGEGTFFYTEVQSAPFYLSGTSKGKSINGVEASYRAEELKYKPACNLYTIFGGIEYAEIDRAALPLEDFTSNKVNYRWYDATATSTCTSSVTINYDGYSVTN